VTSRIKEDINNEIKLYQKLLNGTPTDHCNVRPLMSILASLKEELMECQEH